MIDSSLERLPHQLFDFSKELALLHSLGSLFAFASPFGSGCFLSRFISPFDRSGLNGAHWFGRFEHRWFWLYHDFWLFLSEELGFVEYVFCCFFVDFGLPIRLSFWVIGRELYFFWKKVTLSFLLLDQSIHILFDASHEIAGVFDFLEGLRWCQRGGEHGCMCQDVLDKWGKVDFWVVDANFSFNERIYKAHIINECQSSGAQQIVVLTF